MRFALWKIDQRNNKTHIFFALPNAGLDQNRSSGAFRLSLLSLR
jgi:hypothetical protein